MDTVDSKTRSYMMSRVKGKNTKPELIIRKYLHSQGFRFRLHVSNLPGKPDIVLPKYKLCIFIHGCFWHRHDNCKYATVPKTRTTFWINKLEYNKYRDIRVKLQLHGTGWRVFEIWACGLKNIDNNSLSWLPEYIHSDISMLSWPDYLCSDDKQ